MQFSELFPVFSKFPTVSKAGTMHSIMPSKWNCPMDWNNENSFIWFRLKFYVIAVFLLKLLQIEINFKSLKYELTSAMRWHLILSIYLIHKNFPVVSELSRIQHCTFVNLQSWRYILSLFFLCLDLILSTRMLKIMHDLIATLNVWRK
jgi:hypothetical protein